MASVGLEDPTSDASDQPLVAEDPPPKLVDPADLLIDPLQIDASRLGAASSCAIAGRPLSDSPRECAVLDVSSSLGCQLDPIASSGVRLNVLA